MARVKNVNLEAELIKAATEIISSKGPDHLSVRTVASQCGCSIGTIYNYFHDMNELILKINSLTLIKLERALREAFSKNSDEKLLCSLLAREYLTFAENHLPFWHLLFRYKIPKDQKLPKWYLDIVNKNFDILESALTPHIDTKLVHKASRVLWGSLHGIISLSLEGKLDIVSNESAMTLCESLFRNYLLGVKDSTEA